MLGIHRAEKLVEFVVIVPQEVPVQAAEEMFFLAAPTSVK